jgi:PPK2 family polyphosphate:nucleotide phosphotransferase
MKDAMIDSPYLVKPGSDVNLNKWSTDDTGDFKDKQDGEKAAAHLLKQLIEQQALLAASAKHALLIVLQAMDAGGKDGTVSHVFSGVNPEGCDVTSFKVPTPIEKAHDFLWRIHLAAPPLGMIKIFNRSHYESVLVERVDDLTPEKIWSARYEQINDFEQMLAAENTVILKFFLHISPKEQRKRLEARLTDPSKNWKFSASDVRERAHWDKYMEAYNDALSKCSKKVAPWYIVPADHKWYRNWVISDIIVRALKDLDMKYPKAPEDLEKIGSQLTKE